MIEVHQNLFVGKDADSSSVLGLPGWSILHAAKEPWHRSALGYTTAAAPADHPDYLFARTKENELALNLVDARDPRYISTGAIRAGVEFIRERLATGDKVLCHCNQGQSRGPGVAFLYLMDARVLPRAYQAALEAFQLRCPSFKPSPGMSEYIDSCFPLK